MMIPKIRFRSLTIRIWSYFILMILALGGVFLVINFLMLHQYENDKTYRMLQVYQDIIISGKYNSLPEMRPEPERPNHEEYQKNLEKYIYFRDFGFFWLQDSKHPLIILPGGAHLQPYYDKHRKIIRQISVDVCKAKSSQTRFARRYQRLSVLFLVKKLNRPQKNLYLITFSHRPVPNRDYAQLAFLALLVIFFSLIVSKIISNNLTKPLRVLEQYTEKIARKEWSSPMESDRVDEIGRLFNSMNRMQTALKNADEEEREFLQSISHDLKTPVMIIQSYAQAILDGIYIGDLAQTAKIIRSESSKLEHQIKQLIYLNSLNYLLENEKSTQEIRIDRLLRDLYERFKLVRTDLRWEIFLEEGSVAANPDRLGVALENIIDNQLRYAETKLMIKLVQNPENLSIEISNDGPHINEESLHKIFDKFHKDKQGHFGLGLAISQKIIGFYHGTICVVNHPIGVGFTITLPRIYPTTRPEIPVLPQS